MWAERLRVDPERDPAAAADRIEEFAGAIWPAFRAMSSDETFEWFGELKIPAYTAPAIIATEALVHGFDVARAEEQPWPIDSESARLAVRGLFPLLPEYVNRAAAYDVRVCYELRLRGGPPVYLTIEDGVLSVDETPPRPVDCRLSVDPTAYLLVGYGRTSQWGAALKGQIVAWGRKPWLGLKLGKMIASP